MSRWFLSLVFSFVACHFYAADVRISGKAEAFRNQKVIIYVTADYISDKLQVVQIVNIDNSGNFLAQFEISETRAVTIAIPPYQGLMYAEPGKSYDIVFSYTPNEQVKRFDKTEVPIEFKNMADDDLNLLIRKFNLDYFRFLNEHYYDFAIGEYKGSDVVKSKLANENKGVDLYKKSGTDSAAVAGVSGFGNVITNFYNEIQLKYGEYYRNLFFSAYVRYSMSEIELVSGKNRKVFYREYFSSQPVLVLNPAYMKCLRLFYRNYLSDKKGDQMNVVTKQLNVDRSGTGIIRGLDVDSTASDPVVRSLAVISGLKELYFDKRFSRLNIEACLREINAQTDNKIIAQIAASVHESMRIGKEGSEPADFMLADFDNGLWKFSEEKGMYTYFFFFAQWSPSSVKEMMLLEKLNEQYKDYIRIVAINMDDDFEVFRKYVREHKNQKFTMLFGNTDILLRDKLMLKAIPYAIMVDPDGKIVSDFTRKPGEGIQADFEKIKQKGPVNPRQGPKTWKNK